MAHSLDALLHPKSVAVIGATNEPGRIGGRPIFTMTNAGYAGAIYPVHPKRDVIQDRKAYPSILDVPEPVDCAIVSVPVAGALDTIRQCADAGVKAAIVFTSGFAEMDEGGAELQAEVEEIGRSSGMRILGPNCLGAFNVREGWYGSFGNQYALLRLPPGPIGIVTQSGAYGSHVFGAAQLRGVSANYWVTTGNEADITVAEVIDYYADLDDVKVILAYAEGVTDPQVMRRALEKARDLHKPVVFMKVGVTDAGAAAAQSHTASLAGADAVYEALFRQYGVYRAETTEELVDVAYACQFGLYPTGRRICLHTISGGVGVQMADAASKRDLEVTELPAETQRKMKELNPFAGVRNPVDWTGQSLNDLDIVKEYLRLAIEEGGYDSHVVYLAGAPGSQFMAEGLETLFRELREANPEAPIMMSIMVSDEVLRTYDALKYPAFADPSLAVRAMAALTHFGEVFARGRPADPPPLPATAEAVPSEIVSEYEAKQVLASIGLPVTREALVPDADGAVQIWREMGAPIVLKLSSPDLTHLTEIGGVILNLDDESAIRAAAATLLERKARHAPDARLDGLLVAEMVKGGVETVMGVVRDPVFGPAVMFGLGGILVEVLKDVTFRLAPFDKVEARRMIDEIRARAILDGVRGAPPADLDALADALSRLSVFAAANADKIDSIDINPFVVREKGAVALDALIVPIGHEH